MSDLAKWNVHGPVRTLRTEFAEWDLGLDQWQAARNFTFVRFHPDGRIGESETHNPDGSIARSSYAYDTAGRLQEARHGMDGGPIGKHVYAYDALGRLTRVVSVDEDGTEHELETHSYDPDGKKTKVCLIPQQESDVAFFYGIEGASQSYGAPGATTITTRYGDREQPDEVVFHDDRHRVLRRVTFTRDSTGRLVKEEMHLGQQIPFPGIEEELENQPPEAREAAMAAFAQIFGPNNVMSCTTHAYDGKGLLLERRWLTGKLGGDRTTFRYDDRGNPIEQTSENISREMQMNAEGVFHPTKENSHTQNMRFEHRYDAQGNWTERVVWNRLEPNPNFERSNVERREITYYG